LSGIRSSWSAFWFAGIPSHIYSLLRITLGIAGCISLAGMSDLPAFWSAEGLAPATSAQTVRSYFGTTADWAGPALYFVLLGSFLAMTAGLYSRAAVIVTFVAMSLQRWWNPLPLSAANHLHQAVVFCLMFVNSGAVWSWDAWRRRHNAIDSSQSNDTEPVWPLRLIRYQICLLYLDSAWWKAHDSAWRDGSALHYVFNSNVITRVSSGLPEFLGPLTAATTTLILLWEATFAVMILGRRTRRFAIGAGVLAHVMMWLTLEIGPFTPVVLTAYCAFLSPRRVAGLARGTNR
jgi:hypothetical protein